MTFIADDPARLLATDLCLHAVSKDLTGVMKTVHAETEVCPDECRTLKTVHSLSLRVRRHNCDAKLAAALDGTITVLHLAHAFVNGDVKDRGVHAGEFIWSTPAVYVKGLMAGVTNAGTHRRPAFGECQVCHQPDVFEGRLIGRVLKSRSPDLRGAEITADYRIRWAPSARRGSSIKVVGTLEGAILKECQPARPPG
jgi:hypothetical protein